MPKQKSINEELLIQFFGAYFHQDWKLDAESREMVVAQYKEDIGDEKAIQVAKVIQHELINSDLSDQDLSDKLYEEFGCHYYAGNAPNSTREWLKKVISQLLKRS